MDEIHYFKQTGNPEITVALAGISKWDWEHVKGPELNKALSIMSTKNFDIIPIQDPDGMFKQYYGTTIWGKYNETNIELNQISSSDTLYYLTNIHDAIIKFASTGKNYFFLDNEADVVGLITIGNLNCKHVYLYLYNLIIQLEHALGGFIYSQGLLDKDLISMMQLRVNSFNSRSSLERYRADNQKGFDYNFIEYLFLIDLGYIITKANLLKILELNDEQFNSNLDKINEVRKVVAHPNKSIIRNNQSIKHLSDAIKSIDSLLGKLK
jgi:hypothetical protein